MQVQEVLELLVLSRSPPTIHRVLARQAQVQVQVWREQVQCEVEVEGLDDLVLVKVLQELHVLEQVLHQLVSVQGEVLVAWPQAKY